MERESRLDQEELSLRDLYGSEPESQFFETPIVVDNVAGELVKE
jgi:hypothetical protein